MNHVQTIYAKLAGVLKSVNMLLVETEKGQYRNFAKSNFHPKEVSKYFDSVETQLNSLKEMMPDLYGDFAEIDVDPDVKMGADADISFYYYREQLQALVRDIEQILEIRASSELAIPVSDNTPKIFISHGNADDWKDVQSFIEKDLELPTLELAQEANRGRTILQKLDEEASYCQYAVIVMTGDDKDSEGKPRARENVMHEIGYFQGKFGLSAVCLLHEEGTNIPSNIHGLVYVPFPKGYVNATFGNLMREIQAFYKGVK